MDLTYIAYCGVDCSACSDFVNGKCPGCRQSEWTEENICLPVKCCREKQIACCGECMQFPCEVMKDFYEESEGHRKAYKRMRQMHDKL